MKHRILVLQTYRVERSIEVEIEAATIVLAQEMIEDGRIDVPMFDDPRWLDSRSLEHEETRPARP